MRLAYSALFMLLVPLIMLRLLWRSRKAPAYRERLGERLGYFSLPEDSRPTIWVHAVSLGETLAARPLIEHLLTEQPDHRVLVTTTTPTGSEQVRRIFADRVVHVYAPWDTPGAVKRFLARVTPRLLILMETELWPNMLHYSHASDCRVMLANARLSARSAAGYGRIARQTRSMLNALDWVGAQAAADADRFMQLGMDPSRMHVTGSVKFDIAIDNNMRDRARSLRQSWGPRRPAVIVASTHEGEDGIALDAFADLRAQKPDALLMLAPRHPERFNAVYELVLRSGLTVQRRSANGPVAPDTEVLLVDTLGELLLLFGTADLAVIGGSFVPRGGHNPLEAAAWGLPVLCGPSMFNFADVSRRLSEAGALEQLPSGQALGPALCGLMDDEEEARRRGAAAQAVMEANRGALDQLFAGVESLARFS